MVRASEEAAWLEASLRRADCESRARRRSERSREKCRREIGVLRDEGSHPFFPEDNLERQRRDDRHKGHADAKGLSQSLVSEQLQRPRLSHPTRSPWPLLQPVPP